MPARMCPHCNTKSNFTNKTSQQGFFGSPENRNLVAFDIEQCQNCNGLVLIHKRFKENNAREEVLMYPAVSPFLDESIYKPAAMDYLEGMRCFFINANKAASTMFRRSLQQIMIDKSASGKRLIDQINDLRNKRIITDDLADWANEIRFLGNDGAHPADDGLDEISPDEISQIIEFINGLFQYIYVMPAKVAQSRQRRINN
jgi:hypothetical protein